jgi:Flp pilus assembly protein TadG
MKPRRRSLSRGSTLLEFTFVGIPLIFVLISIFEAARGMWIYTSLANGVKAGMRYVVVNGTGHTGACTGTQCSLTVQAVARVINNAAAGLSVPGETELQGVNNVTIAGFACGNLQACLADTTVIPLTPMGGPVTVTAQYNFVNAISLFWPGAGKGSQLPAFQLPAAAQEYVQF